MNNNEIIKLKQELQANIGTFNKLIQDGLGNLNGENIGNSITSLRYGAGTLNTIISTVEALKELMEPAQNDSPTDELNEGDK